MIQPSDELDRRVRDDLGAARGHRQQYWNLVRLGDIGDWLTVIHGDIEPPELSHDDRLLARDAAVTAAGLDWSIAPWKALTSALAEATGRKGRPLFMPLRLALTGRDSGPEMAALVERIGQDRTVRRLELAARR